MYEVPLSRLHELTDVAARLTAERDALRAAIQAVEGHAKIEAEKHLPDMQNGGCTCGFCAYSIEHVVVMSLRAALAAAGVDREDTEHGDKPCEADYSGYCPTCKRDSRDTGQADEPQRQRVLSGLAAHREAQRLGRPARTTPVDDARASGGSFQRAGQVVPQQPTCEHGFTSMHGPVFKGSHMDKHATCPGPVGQDTTGEQQ
jgi:hypothetical protein